MYNILNFVFILIFNLGKSVDNNANLNEGFFRAIFKCKTKDVDYLRKTLEPSLEIITLVLGHKMKLLPYVT